MTINFKIKFSKRALCTLITLGILIIFGIGVYAFGSVPNLGHGLDELYTCADGKTLVARNGMWNCENVAWEFKNRGIEYFGDYVGIGYGVGHYDDEIKLSVKGAIQLNVYTSFSTVPPCTSLTRGTIILVTTWDKTPHDKMYACLYNVNDYEYVRI